MASQAKLRIRVSAARGSSTISYSTTGRYISLQTNGINDVLAREPIQQTISSKAFWLSVLAAVTADINALP